MADFYGRPVNQASINDEIKVYKQMGKSKADAKKKSKSISKRNKSK